MASKSKRARMAPQENLPRKFMYWAIAVLLVKIVIIFRIQGLNAGSGDRVYFVDGAWLGADGENYLMGYFALIRDGVFSAESILNYWPAGYPLFIFLLSLLGKSWVLTTLSIFQSIVFSYAVYIFATQLSKTRLKKYSYLAFVLIILNPTLSLSSIVIGYESITASGLLISCALIVKDFIEKDDKKFVKYLVINSLILGFLAFVQPRLIISGALILLLWIYLRKGIKTGIKSLIISFLILAMFPTSLIIRNYQALGLTSISTNLGVTMNLGAGDGATGGYVGSTSKAGVPCETTGNSVEQDNQRVKCVLNWYLKNPIKSMELFYNKSINFWSPWDGPLTNGTMARNPWLTVSPIRDIAQSSEDGNKLVNGTAGKITSWAWLLSALGLLLYGFLILWRQGSIEKLLAALALIAIVTNWAISLMTIGDHRFRIPIMGLSLFLQAIGLKTLLRGGKPAMVDGPALR
jgi:hypothetical protein